MQPASGGEKKEDIFMVQIKFEELTVERRAWVTEKLREDKRRLCEYTFAGNYTWSRFFALRLAVSADETCGIFRYERKNNDVYSFPVGGSDEDKRGLLALVMAACEESGKVLQLSPIARADYERLRRWYPGEFLAGANRDLSDYIYEREKLVKLAGKKFHGKRNHIARFKDAGDWGYEPITDSNRGDAQAMMEQWKENRSEEWNVELEQEFCAMMTGLLESEALGLRGGLLRKAGRVVALALGEPLSDDTFVVHFEKAFADVQGAYPMINQQFAEHAAEGFTYIDREEDTGDPGLRKAKLSYHPYKLEEKYTAIRSEVVFADPTDDQTVRQVCELWQRCFDDGDFSDFYMKRRAEDKNMLLIYRDGRPVSMASFLPAVYETNKGAVPVRYTYAVATLPEYRRQGLAEKILMCAAGLWDEPLVLSPADESLYRYYERMGFVRCFRGENVGERLVPRKNCRWNFCVEKADAQAYAALRSEYFSAHRNAFLEWDADAIAFAFELNEREGGKNRFLVSESSPQKRELLMYNIQGQELVILETTLSEEILCGLLPELFAETGTKRVRYEIPSGMLRLPERLKGFELPAGGYLNLTLA